jgi:hypothetical protein
MAVAALSFPSERFVIPMKTRRGQRKASPTPKKERDKIMAIVSKSEGGNKVTLYEIPDSDLNRYQIPEDKLAQMFPQKESRSKDDAVMRSAVATSGDVTAYNSPELCCGWVYYGPGDSRWQCWSC